MSINLLNFQDEDNLWIMAAKYIILSLESIMASAEPIILFGRIDAKLELQYENNYG